MQVRNEKGVTLVLLAIIVIVLSILTTVTIREIGTLMNNVRLETMSTNLLLIQAKAKVIYEKSNFHDDDSLLKGQKVSEITNNDALDDIITNGIISTSEEYYDSYYLWDKQTINELELNIPDMKDEEFFIVNYVTEEVVTSKGYKHTDNIKYYKLSEILELD